MAEELDGEKAERMAAERNRKRAEQCPLFADQLEQATAADIKRAWEEHRRRFQETLDRLRAVGEAFREKVRALVDDVTFQALESRRLNLPPSAEYHAAFWRQRYEELQRG